MNSDSSLTFTERARRAQIISSAVETIAELGFGGASLVRIAERAGTSKGVVTYHFASKDELIQAVYDDAVRQAREHVLDQMRAATTGAEALRTYIDSNLAFMAESRTLMVAVVEIVAGARDVTGLPLYGIKQRDLIVTPLEQLLRHYQEAGDFREFDPRAIAVAIRAVIDAVPPRLFRDPDFDVEQYGAEIVTAFDLATAPDHRGEP